MLLCHLQHDRYFGTVLRAHHPIMFPSVGSILGTEALLCRWGLSPPLALMQSTYIAYRVHLTYMSDPATFGSCHESQKKPTDES